MPTDLLKDRMLGDDLTQGVIAKPAPRSGFNPLEDQAGLNRKCPDSTLPTASQPFVFYHMESSNGEVLVPLLTKSLVAINASMAVPGEGRLPEKCSVAWDADPQQAASCNADPGFWKASFYYGHFSPLRLGRVSNGHCFLMLRNPVGRAMGHFRLKRLAESMFGGKSFESLDTSQIQAAVAATGGGLYASKFLGCGGKDCEDKKARTVLTVAREQLSRCHVGITEKPRETMSYLMMLLPWFQGSFTIMDEGGSQVEDRLTMQQFNREMRSKLYGMFQGDHFLYEDGQKFFQKQLLGAVTCYTQEKYMGDESSLARDIRKIARRVTRRNRQDRDQMSVCLERRKLCLAPEVDQRSCSCSEFVDFRED